MWVPFPDLLISAKFYRYRLNSFLGGRRPKIGCSHWLEGWPLQQLELYRALLWLVIPVTKYWCHISIDISTASISQVWYSHIGISIDISTDMSTDIHIHGKPANFLLFHWFPSTFPSSTRRTANTGRECTLKHVLALVQYPNRCS